MKTSAILTLLTCFTICQPGGLAAGHPPSEAPARPGAAFLPTKTYREDEKVSLVLKNCSITEFGQVLANLTQKEVLISEHVMRRMLPAIEINDYPNEVMRVMTEKIKEGGIRIGELYPYTLVCFECPAPMLESAFELK